MPRGASDPCASVRHTKQLRRHLGLSRLERDLWHPTKMEEVPTCGECGRRGAPNCRTTNEKTSRRRARGVDWLAEKDYRNVLLEIDNECDVRAYHHAILKADRVHELIALAHRRAESKQFPLRVGTSYAGGVVPKENVVRASDFLLMHGNGVGRPARIAEMVRQARQVAGYRPMPILFNEDDHYEFDKPTNNFRAAIDEYASWGYFDYRRPGESFDDGYQSVPANWGISSPRKQSFFKLLSEITGEKP